MKQTNLLKPNVYECRKDILNFGFLFKFFNYKVFHKKLKGNFKKLLYQNKLIN